VKEPEVRAGNSWILEWLSYSYIERNKRLNKELIDK
jgi:hypothetical protein